MKTSLQALALLGLTAAAVPAHAQEAEATPKTRFYNFDALELDGGRARPNVLYTNARQRAQFGRLFSLKRSFLPELELTGAGTAVAPKATRASVRGSSK